MKNQTPFSTETRIPMPSNNASRFNAIDLSNTTRFENRFSLGNNPSSFGERNQSSFPMGIGSGNRSGTGLEMSPVSDNFQNLMTTYDQIAQEQRSSEDQRKSDSDYLYQSDTSSDNDRFSPNYDSFESRTSETINPNNFSESPSGSFESSPSQGITPEFAKQVEESGYGPIASMEPQQSRSGSPELEAPKNNLYNTTNKTMEIDSKIDQNRPQPQQEQYGGGGASTQMPSPPSPPPPAGGRRDRDDSLSKISQTTHAYPHWMWGIG